MATSPVAAAACAATIPVVAAPSVIATVLLIHFSFCLSYGNDVTETVFCCLSNGNDVANTMFICLSNGNDVIENKFVCLCNGNAVADIINSASVTVTRVLRKWELVGGDKTIHISKSRPF